jgi:HAE1 family hydrophobic/amphiphilic exporter-1
VSRTGNRIPRLPLGTAVAQVARDVSTAFYDVLVARELAAIAEQDLAQEGRHLEQARRMQAAALATDYDALAAGVAVENARR